MRAVDRQTLQNGAIGGIVGAALGVVPLVLLVAPLIGGGVAGYLERDGAKRGVIAGAIAGVLMAALSTLITGVILFSRVGDLPVGTGAPLASLGIAALLSLAATAGQIIVAGIGGGLGAILAADRATSAPEPRLEPGTASRSTGRRWWAVIVGSLAAGVVVFLGVTFALTTVLDPLIWPSLLVGLPIGFIAGTAVAVLGYRYGTRRADDRIYWRAVSIGAVTVSVVFILLVGGLSFLGQERVEQTTQSTYEYQVTISTDGSLEEPTFYVPVPQTNGETELGERFVQNVQYSRDVPVMEGSDREPAPVNFTYELVDTEHGRMLAIAADRIEVSRVYYREIENGTMGWREPISAEAYDPDDPSMGVLHDGSFSFSVTVGADERIETAEPAGTEPLLVPRYEQVEVECRYGFSETHHCYEYAGRVYAAYDTAPETTVYVSTELSGRNEWFSGGWTGNEYRQWAYTELHGPGTGWYELLGELEVGSGRYRS